MTSTAKRRGWGARGLLAAGFAFALVTGRRLILVLLVCGYLAFLWWLPPAPTVAVVHAKSEQVSYTVLVPEMARFQLAGYGVRGEAAIAAPAPRAAARPATDAAAASARSSGPTPLLCLGGLIEPASGTKVTIRRTSQDPVRIILDRTDDKPVADFRGQSRAVPPAIQSASWLVVEESESCSGTANRRLPINGIVELGDELRPQTSLEEASSAPLIEGRVEIFGKTLDLSAFIGNRLLDLSQFARDRRTRLYPVMEIAFPPGSRVWEADTPDRSAPRQPWAGMALIEPDTSALQIEVTTEATSLAIARPGGGTEPEILRIGMFAQLTNDPNVLALQVALAVIFALLQTVGGWLAPREDRD